MLLGYEGYSGSVYGKVFFLAFYFRLSRSSSSSEYTVMYPKNTADGGKNKI